MYHTTFDFVLDHAKQGGDRSIVAGDNLHGKLTVTGKYKNPRTCLTLCFVGKEETLIRGTKSEHSICMTRITIQEAGTTYMAAGKHVYPFDIPLPDSLPSSMKYARGKSGYCKKTYSLQVESTSRQTTSICAEEEIQVSALPSPNTISATISPTVQEVRSVRAVLGTMTMAARVPNARVAKGSTLQVYLACRNHSSVKISRVQVVLMEQFDWTAKSQQDSSQRSIAHMGNVQIPGILLSKKDTARTEPESDLDKELERDVNLFSVQVPSRCEESYEGSILQVCHTLKITFLTKPLVSNPTIEIPIQIGAPTQTPIPIPPRPVVPRASSGIIYCA